MRGPIATMKAVPHLLSAIALLAGGVLLGRAWHSAAGRESTGNVVDKTPPPRPGRPDPYAATEKPRGKAGRAPADDSLRGALARLDVSTLHALILEQHPAAEGLSDDERKIRRGLLDAALEELWDRQGTAALEWAAALEAKEERGDLSRGLLENGLREDPAAVIPWMEKFHAEFGKSATNNGFLSIAMKGAAGRDADEVIRVFGMFSGTNLSNPLFIAKYPEGFDFGKLYAALQGKTDLKGAITEWALRDRDAAWAAVTATPAGGRGGYREDPVGYLLNATIASSGEAAGVGWIMERLATLSPEERGKRLAGLDPGGRLSEEGIAAIAGGLAPAERAVYAAAIVKEHGASPRAYAALDTLPRADLLAALRTDLRGSNDSIGPAPGTAARAAYMDRLHREVQERYQLTAEEMASILVK